MPSRICSTALLRITGRETTAGMKEPQAFAVMVEHGGYGGQVAAPIAREIMEAAQQLGLIPTQP